MNSLFLGERAVRVINKSSIDGLPMIALDTEFSAKNQILIFDFVNRHSVSLIIEQRLGLMDIFDPHFSVPEVPIAVR